MSDEKKLTLLDQLGGSVSFRHGGGIGTSISQKGSVETFGVNLCLSISTKDRYCLGGEYHFGGSDSKIIAGFDETTRTSQESGSFAFTTISEGDAIDVLRRFSIGTGNTTVQETSETVFTLASGRSLGFLIPFSKQVGVSLFGGIQIEQQEAGDKSIDDRIDLRATIEAHLQLKGEGLTSQKDEKLHPLAFSFEVAERLHALSFTVFSANNLNAPSEEAQGIGAGGDDLLNPGPSEDIKVLQLLNNHQLADGERNTKRFFLLAGEKWNLVPLLLEGVGGVGLLVAASDLGISGGSAGTLRFARAGKMWIYAAYGVDTPKQRNALRRKAQERGEIPEEAVKAQFQKATELNLALSGGLALLSLLLLSSSDDPQATSDPELKFFSIGLVNAFTSELLSLDPLETGVVGKSMISYIPFAMQSTEEGTSNRGGILVQHEMDRFFFLKGAAAEVRLLSPAFTIANSARRGSDTFDVEAPEDITPFHDPGAAAETVAAFGPEWRSKFVHAALFGEAAILFGSKHTASAGVGAALDLHLPEIEAFGGKFQISAGARASAHVQLGGGEPEKKLEFAIHAGPRF